ncbi:MAG: RIP metalloprotease RseP [candidate division WOR-3 bacterium]|jgi:regulator of sigma E protease
MVLGIIVALIALSVMVFVHEFFHLIVAKWSKMSAPVFSIGLGPKLFSFFKWGETEFRISAVPFGGYVEIKGMDPDEMKGGDDEFYSKNIFLKIGVVFAGPFANFALGFLIFLFVLLFNGIDIIPTISIGKANSASNLLSGDKILAIDDKKVFNWYEITEKIEQNSKISLIREGKETEITVDSLVIDSLIPFIPPVVGNIIKDLPAAKAGIEKGDTIVKIQNKPIKNWEDITNIIHPAAEETLSIVYLSGGDTVKTNIIPDKQKTIEGDSIVNIGIIGIESPSTKMSVGGIQAISFAWQQSWNTATLIYRTFSWLFQRKLSPKEVSGPIGIVRITQKSLDRGFISLLMFVALITINLAIVNLIPIPPLDGFHIIMSLATFTSRRPPSKTLLKIVQTIGTIIILILMGLIIFNDIIKWIQGRL